MRLKGFLSGLLILAYTFALVMSTGHLSEWYRLTLGSLPGWFAVGLAAALEMSAFLLSLLSNSLLKGSKWASWGAVVALGLVWVGNWFSMRRAGEGIPEVEIFLSSLFVPVSTYVVAKVLGELLENRVETPQDVSLGEHPHKEAVHKMFPSGSIVNPPHMGETLTPLVTGSHPHQIRATPVTNGEAQPSKNGEVQVLSQDTSSLRSSKGEWKHRYLNALENPKTARELMDALGLARPTVYKQLKQLEAEGLVRNSGGRWMRVDRG